MEKIIINGGRPLIGSIEVSGSKNAAIPIILATMMVDDVCVIENVPSISDISLSLEILAAMGCQIRMLSRDTVEIPPNHQRWLILDKILICYTRVSPHLWER